MSNNELLNMKRKALMLGLCGEYKKKWDSCASKKELIDLVLDSNGVEFLADAITFGWGCSQEFLLNEFADFINGKYQRKKDGYTSELYVEPHGKIELRSTLTVIAGGRASVIVPPNFFGRVYVCGDGGSLIFGSNGGSIELFVYGENERAVTKYATSLKVKRKDIKESQWRK